MATFTRKFLKGMQLTDEQVDAIIDAHADVVDGLKEQIDSYKEDADKLKDVQKQLKDAQAELESAKKDSWKVKYDALKEEYDEYKESQTKKATHEAKVNAYRGLLKEAGISEKHIDAVLKVSDVDGVSLTSEGKIDGADSLLSSIKDEWSEFIQTTEQKGADVSKPPANNGAAGTMTKEDIMKMKDPVKRQDAIAKNMDLFTGKDD